LAKTSIREICPLTWPNPSQEIAAIATTPTESDVIIRIAREDFTSVGYLHDSVEGLWRHRYLS
jgi:hypothetical protein